MVPPTAVTDANAGGSGIAVKDPVKDTILTPRFYTTDFDAMAEMDLRPNEAELEAICEEFRKDYNRHHFVVVSESTSKSPNHRHVRPRAESLEFIFPGS